MTRITQITQVTEKFAQAANVSYIVMRITRCFDNDLESSW
jgi:hypothetical protein